MGKHGRNGLRVSCRGTLDISPIKDKKRKKKTGVGDLYVSLSGALRLPR